MFIISNGKSCRKKCCCTLKSAMTTLLMNIILPDLDTGFQLLLPKGINNKAALIISELAFSPFNINKISIRCKDCLIICGQAALIKEPPIFKISENIKYKRVRRLHTYSVLLNYRFFGQRWAYFSLFLLRRSFFHWYPCLIQHCM